LRELEQKKDRLKARLGTLVGHAGHLETRLRGCRELLGRQGPLHALFDSVEVCLGRETGLQEATGKELDQASELLRRAGEALGTLRAREEAQRRRVRELESLISSSEEEMRLAMDDRDQWRRRCGEWEQERGELSDRLAGLEKQATDLDRLQQEWMEDREQARRLRAELEENLELLRGRIEHERASHQRLLQEREEMLKESARRKSEQQERTREALAAELTRAEEKLEEAIKTQQLLAEQNLRGERERKALLRELEAARRGTEPPEPV